jgi:predicted site-specific integrase-resolvase
MKLSGWAKKMGTSYETADNAQDVIHDLTPIVYSFCVRPHGVRRIQTPGKTRSNQNELA